MPTRVFVAMSEKRGGGASTADKLFPSYTLTWEKVDSMKTVNFIKIVSSDYQINSQKNIYDRCLGD
jgi:hypothetical protein